MSTKKRTPSDPAAAANERVLENIRQREEQRRAEEALAADIGLDLKQPESKADTAAEFLADEWDRKAFGDPVKTFSRVVYGPDDLLKQFPRMKETINAIGLERYADATAEALRTKGANAVPDPLMRRTLAASIAKFGIDAVAKAFHERIMRIPQRTVEVESDREDPMLLSRPLEEAVERYGTPGMAPKFLSERCIQRFGMRGYQVVKDEKGDPVKVGTLIMGEIPEKMAERRRRFYAEQSNEALNQIEDGYRASVERDIGAKSGFSVLNTGENVNASAAGDFDDDPSLSRSYLGRSRATGFRLDREA
jgi:hypothetical protein